MSARLATLKRRVEQAIAEARTSEYTIPNGYYAKLYDWTFRASLAERTDLAEVIYLHGDGELRGSRIFDNCFEMGEGRKVCVALSERAATDATLHARIAEDFGGTYPAHWVAAAAQIELAL